MAGSLLDNRGRIESLWDKDFIEGVCGEKFRILSAIDNASRPLYSSTASPLYCSSRSVLSFFASWSVPRWNNALNKYDRL